MDVSDAATDGAANAAAAVANDDVYGYDGMGGGDARVDVEALLASRAVTAPLGWEHVSMSCLQDLNLSHWRSLKSIQLESARAAKLEALHLKGCEQLASVDLTKLPALRYLDASACPVLHTVSLRGCAGLETLKLSHCKAVDVIDAPDSPKIGTLSLFGCRNFGGGSLEALLKVCGGALRSLDVNGAIGTENVTEATLHQLCPALSHLDSRGRARKH